MLVITQTSSHGAVSFETSHRPFNGLCRYVRVGDVEQLTVAIHNPRLILLVYGLIPYATTLDGVKITRDRLLSNLEVVDAFQG